jgi:hypothetical protein
MEGIAAFAAWLLGDALAVEVTLLVGFILVLNCKSLVYAGIRRLTTRPKESQEQP